MTKKANKYRKIKTYKVSKYLIYALVDPRTQQWRYIGRSCSGLKRPKQHINPSMLKREGETHKARWLRQLIKLGLKPSIEVLEEFNSESPLNEAEIEWIAEARRQGCRLTNVVDGGGGCSGRQVTPDQVRRISDGNIETKRKFTKEQEKELCELYKSGKTTYELQELFPYERHTISKWLKRNGLIPNPKPIASRRRVKVEDLPEVVKMYQDGASLRQIAAKFDTCHSNIIGNLKIPGISRRSKSESLINHFKRAA